ncbi:MAG: hypothetical protein FWE72_07630, partial [Spirochaetaceae bacterium]|nr:hypothetical protein [Spirochaetaceae bacterium]
GITVHALNGTDTKTYTVEVDNLPEPYVGDSVFTFYSSWNSLPWASYGFGGTPTLPSGSTVVTDSNLANNFSRPYSWPDFEPGFEGVMIMLEGSNVSAIAGIFGNDLVSNYNFIDYTGLTNHHIYVKIAGINYYQVSMFEFDKYLLIMVFKFYEYDGGGGGETTFYVSNATEWQNAIDAIKNDADNYVFTINITANITGAAGYNVSTATFGSRYGIQVEIDGGGYSISLAPDQTGSLLHIGYGQAVSFEDVKLIGNSTNNSPLVMLSGGDMVMEGSSAISNNTNINPSGYGGGVFVGVYGNLFLMDGTSISNNKANQGGGVFVDTGNLKMYSDSIINNNVSNQGGGVYVNSGSLVMYSGSKIDYNDADLQGGGVYIVAQNNGDFYKHIGATLTGNTGNNTNILEEKLPATKEGHQAFVLVSSNPSDPLQARVYNSNIPPQFVLDSESDGWESWY